MSTQDDFRNAADDLSKPMQITADKIARAHKMFEDPHPTDTAWTEFVASALGDLYVELYQMGIGDIESVKTKIERIDEIRALKKRLAELESGKD
jgi:hypothetical protein